MPDYSRSAQLCLPSDRSAGRAARGWGMLPDMQPRGVRLSIDYGTATTTAVATGVGGRTVPVLVEGDPSMPSGVAADPQTGQLVAGAAAQAAGVDRPDCYVAFPKRCIGRGQVDVGGRQVEVVDLVATALRLVRTETTRTIGAPVERVILAVPAGWGPRRRQVLAEAARRAGLPPPAMVAAPVAVATGLFADTPTAVPVGGCLLVCDAGAGSLDLAVVQRTPTG